jgi:hypothetical protein
MRPGDKARPKECANQKRRQGLVSLAIYFFVNDGNLPVIVSEFVPIFVQGTNSSVLNSPVCVVKNRNTRFAGKARLATYSIRCTTGIPCYPELTGIGQQTDRESIKYD